VNSPGATTASAGALDTTVAAPVAHLEIGSIVAATYHVEHRIGSGGIGQVYAAKHVRTGRRVAIKVLRSEFTDRPVTAARFRKEANFLGSMESEHIVSVLDCGDLPDGTPYFVMELLRGEDLRTRLANERRLDPIEALRVARDACLGLRDMHDVGVIHRDLKPANLFLSRRRDGSSRCKILDFGVAKALSSEDWTNENALLGTVRYMAPEQIVQDSKPDERTDVYALGVILYEMLVGASPHHGETTEELMFAIANRPPASPLIARPELGEALASVVLRCLSRSPADRYHSATELEAALRAVGAGTDSFPAQGSSAETTPDSTPVKGLTGRGAIARAPLGYSWIVGSILSSVASATLTWWLTSSRGTDGLDAQGEFPGAIPKSSRVTAPVPSPRALVQALSPAPQMIATPSLPRAPTPLASAHKRPPPAASNSNGFGHFLEERSPYGSDP
jgi:serine/threonine protein kinase